MERLTLDEEGARTGEISQASLQMGDDTVAVQRIATMTLEAQTFKPWDTPGNKRQRGLYATFSGAFTFFAVMGFAWWGLSPVDGSGIFGLLAALVFGAGAIAFLVQAGRYAIHMRRTQSYFRLLIGTSDGRHIPLVDDNRAVLQEIRDFVREKMDTDDPNLTGTFNLNLDEVRFSRAGVTRKA